ncbi:MAG: deoxyribonuclease IV [Clostridium sp.]|nr:deoxyribonuclease IV [Clostridium sp.]MCM1444604.1 deoxyribonuclease IV [Candidatus Amulumruptor caecigallinarius]
MIIGSHVSFKKETQLLGSVEEALSYKSDTFMFYTGAPQNTNRIPINNNITLKAKKLMKDNNINIGNVIVHAPYIINPANPNNIDFNVNFFRQELQRVESFGVEKIVLHPGSHIGLGMDVGIKNLIEFLNKVMSNDMKVSICIETMAGKGSELMTDFNDIKYVLDNVNIKDKLMVCLDTCHVNDAGYDIENVIDEFDKIIGIKKLGCIHINDSKNVLGSHKDRHENIGLGTIGFDKLLRVIYDDRLKDIPMILETPYIPKFDNDKEKIYPPYKFEIEMIRNKKLNENLIDDIRNYYK